MNDSDQAPTRRTVTTFETESVDEARTAIMKRLIFWYNLLYPGRSDASFYKELVQPFVECEEGATPVFEFTYSAAHSEHTFKAILPFMMEATKFCLLAFDAGEDGREVDAWRNIANAMNRLGSLEVSIVLEPTVQHIIASRSSAGAQKRTEKYAPLRELARELASKGGYKSKRQAALKIQEKILAEAKQIGVGLSETQAERTITGWLDGMLFGGKREP